uniref:FK506-binding protein n=1 Tax=Lepeophtheirus salmonis TaxID=72036 RepID=D3PG52_LEPSM|nr:39 kDa FK506-binding nuclear protein [Lepeophtheirus salmonis]
MAAVEATTLGSKITSVFVEAGGDEFLICNLNNSNLNVHLDLNFLEGEKIGFRATGPGTVHLTGYLIPDTDDMIDDLDSESECFEEHEEEAPVLVNGKGKNTKRKPDNSLIDTPNKKAKKELELARAKKVQSDLNLKKKSQKKVESSDDDNDVEADDDTSDDGILDFTENYAEEEDSVDESDDEYEDDSSVEEGDSSPTKKILEKIANKKESSLTTPKNNKKKDNASTPKGATPKSAVKEQPKTPKSPKSFNVNGIQCEDIRVGSGPEVKKGKIIGMYYDGRLKNNNKRFDATLQGKPFKFRLGSGEVIKGWDLGFEGMKVGGKRRLTIPPKLAYGTHGAPPDIPPNSTLVFEVECKFVK